MEHKKLEILRWKCPKCGKEIMALYEGQFEHLKKQHNLKHS